MVYKRGFIACCKVDGKILREDAGVVTLPFGCEYSVLLKNLNSVRAQVKVSVDGTDATEGTWLIIPANGEIELERFIRAGNMDCGNRFKFIERTGDIEAHKGIGAADGLIRVEYKAEVVDEVRKTVVEHVEHVYHHNRPWYYDRYWPYGPYYGNNGITYGTGTAQSDTANGDIFSGLNKQVGSVTNTSSSHNSPTASTAKGKSPLRSSGISSSSHFQGTMQANHANVVRSAAMNDVGITVPGSESSQKFVSGAWFKTEATSQVIVLQLRGMVAGKAVKKAVTVKSKAKCPTCGTPNKSNMKFCGKCGTSLTII